MNASMDVQHQKIKKTKKDKHAYLSVEQMVYLQGVSITEGDQEVIMKTYIKARKSEQGEKTHKTVIRKSISQRHQASFPVLAYNIGLRKLIIQNTLQQCLSVVYEIPKNE